MHRPGDPADSGRDLIETASATVLVLKTVHAPHELGYPGPAINVGIQSADLPVHEDLRRIHLSTLLIATRRLGRRLAKLTSVYEPDRTAIQRSLRALSA